MSIRFLVSISVLSGVVTLAQAPPPELTSLIDRAAAIVADLEQRAPVLIAEERYAQTAETSKNLGGTTVGVPGGGGGAAMQEGDTVRTKHQSRSEVLFVRPPRVPLTWSAARHVLDINEKPSGNAPGRFDALVTDRAALESQWTGLADASRSVHVGTVVREFNAPMAPLALLRADQRERIQFRKDGEERIRGTLTWKVSFAEQRGPTLFRTRGNVPLASRGTFWIDPHTARVFRTKIDAGDGLSVEQWRIEVDYALDPAIDAMLPSELRDRYQDGRGKVDGKATYSGYRVPGGTAVPGGR